MLIIPIKSSGLKNVFEFFLQLYIFVWMGVTAASSFASVIVWSRLSIHYAAEKTGHQKRSLDLAMVSWDVDVAYIFSQTARLSMYFQKCSKFE